MGSAELKVEQIFSSFNISRTHEGSSDKCKDIIGKHLSKSNDFQIQEILKPDGCKI